MGHQVNGRKVTEVLWDRKKNIQQIVKMGTAAAGRNTLWRAVSVRKTFKNKNKRQAMQK